MSRFALLFAYAIAMMGIFVNADHDQIPDQKYFERELMCRKGLIAFGKKPYAIYAFAGITIVFSVIQLVALIIFARFVKSSVSYSLFSIINPVIFQMCANANLVIDKCHTVMDAVLVGLFPNNVMAELTGHNDKSPKKKQDSKKSNDTKKESK